MRPDDAGRYDPGRRSTKIVTTLILTHGALAHELLASARKIVGTETEHLAALSLEWDDSLEVAAEKLRRAVALLPREDGLLILTDMYGGTPHNVALKLRSPGAVEVVSGVNLPMVVRLSCQGACPPMPLEELAVWIRDKARRSICHGGVEGNPTGSDCSGRA